MKDFKMNVKVNNKEYSVEFSTEAQMPKYGKDKKNKVLVKTICSISDCSFALVSRGSATQNYRDELNWEEGRRFSMKRALKYIIKKEDRITFWKEYMRKYPISKK